MPPVLSQRPGVAILSSRRLDVWLIGSCRVFPSFFSLGKREQMKHLAGLHLPDGSLSSIKEHLALVSPEVVKKNRKEKILPGSARYIPFNLRCPA